jgi:hypothetical protein
MVQQSTGVAVELLVDMSCAGCVKPVHEALRSVPGTQPAPPLIISNVLSFPIASLGARRDHPTTLLCHARAGRVVLLRRCLLSPPVVSSWSNLARLEPCARGCCRPGREHTGEGNALCRTRSG